MKQSKIIGICGGSGSGKTTIVKNIEKIIKDFVFIPQDNYYKSAEYVNNDNITAFNFDHPDAIDNELLYNQLKSLKNNEIIQMPQYDFVRNKRLEETTLVKPKKLIIVEGIFIFFYKKIRDLIDLKIYVDTPDDIRFIRRLKRDIKDRGRTLDSVVSQYLEFVRPGHYEFVEPTKVYADIIVPEGGFNQRAINVFIPFLKNIIDD